jgi:hypothetical protein
MDPAAHTATEVVGFLAYGPSFLGGVRVAVGALAAGGLGQVITGAGPGGGPHVRAFQVGPGTVTPTLSFFAYQPAFSRGVFVSSYSP